MEFAPFIPIALLAIAGIGYLIKRHIEGKRESEVVDNAHKWARLYREVHDRPPSLQDIIRLKAVFMENKRRSSDAEGEQRVTVAADEAPEWMFLGYELSEYEREKAARGEGIWTQLELNEQAAKAAQLIDENLTTACNALRRLLLPSEIEGFDTAYAKWTDYRSAQATYAGSQYEGGSIAPMIYWSEYFGVTKAKLETTREDCRFRGEMTTREQALVTELAETPHGASPG